VGKVPIDAVQFALSSVATAVWPRFQQLLPWPCDAVYCTVGEWGSRSWWFSSW